MAEPWILVVEDDPDHREILRASLTHAGFGVKLAVDGEEGVRRALRERPPLVLMDAQLPRVDGWQATERIRQAAPEVRVVMLSAHAFPEHRRMALAVGCDRYLTKPIRPADLVDALRELLQGAADERLRAAR